MDYKLVLIDDNFAIRQSIKALLSHVSKKYHVDLNVFSTDNGVEGLGYIYITSPNIIIIDTTLPKYSGRNVVEYLIHNPRFRSENVKVIVLQESSKRDLVLPPNFILVDKSNTKAFEDLWKCVLSFLQIAPQEYKKSLFSTLNGFIFRHANKDDVLDNNLEKKPLIPRVITRGQKLGLGLTSKIILSLLVLMYGKPRKRISPNCIWIEKHFEDSIILLS